MKVIKVQVRPENTPGRIQKKIKMYIFPAETLMENLANRRDRPYIEYKKTVIPQVLAKIKKKNPDLYGKIKDIKWKWSQTAGCACGCSPGFTGGNLPINIFVDIK